MDWDTRKAALVAKHGIKPASDSAHPALAPHGDAVTVRPYAPPSFFSALGVLAKVAQLKRKGFPQTQKNWRFITLTFDRSKHPDPEKAYEIGLRHLRQFFYELRKAGFTIPRYCWKLEFHEPDETGQVWPHFHVLLDYKRPIPADVVRTLWGKGRVDIEGVTDARFDYLFKYVAKAPEHVPHWILDRSRVRCWQTSVGFYAKNSAAPARTANKASPRPSSTTVARNTQNDTRSSECIGERIERWRRSCTLISKNTVTKAVTDSNGVTTKESRLATIYTAAQLADGLSWGRAAVTLARRTLDRHEDFAGLIGFSVSANKIQIPDKSCLTHLLPLQPPSAPALM